MSGAAPSADDNGRREGGDHRPVLVVLLGRRRRALRAPGRRAAPAGLRGEDDHGERPARPVHARSPPAARPPRQSAARRDPDRPLGDRSGERDAAEHHPQSAFDLPDPCRARARAVRRPPPPRADDADSLHRYARVVRRADGRNVPRERRPRLDEDRQARLGVPRRPARSPHRRLRDGEGLRATLAPRRLRDHPERCAHPRPKRTRTGARIASSSRAATKGARACTCSCTRGRRSAGVPVSICA